MEDFYYKLKHSREHRLISLKFSHPFICIFFSVSSFYNIMSDLFQLHIFLLWSRGDWNDNTTRKWVIKNILKENSTYINDTSPQLNKIMNITPILGDGSPRLHRRELNRYVSHEDMSIGRGYTPTLTYIVANVPDCREFKLQLCSYLHFRINTLGKSMNSHLPLFYGLNSINVVLLQG